MSWNNNWLRLSLWINEGVYFGRYLLWFNSKLLIFVSKNVQIEVR
jgi:hypothetical protein